MSKENKKKPVVTETAFQEQTLKGTY